MIPRSISLSCAAALAALPLLTATPQDGEDDRERGLAPTLEEMVRPQEDELRRLFLEVERNLKRIDELLNDASSGDVPLDAVGDSGIDELLRRTGRESQQVLSGIDRILEVARQRGQGQPSGASGSGQGEGQPKPESSPLDESRGGERQQGEATPEGVDPRDEPGGAKPQDGREPDSPQGSDAPGENAPGVELDLEQGDPRAIGPDADTWGMLPDKVQEIFRNEGTEDLPVQYRDWIDAYYRRLNAVDR